MSNISYSSSPYPPFSFNISPAHSWTSFNRYDFSIYVHVHTAFVPYPFSCTRFPHLLLFPLIPISPGKTYSAFLFSDFVKEKKPYCLFKIDTQGVSLKRLPTEWEKLCASCASIKRLITRICRKLKKLNSPKFNDSMKKWANETNRAFSKEEVQMDKKHIKKFSTSFAKKEMQIKTMFRFHLTAVRMATIQNTNTINVGENVGKEKPSYTPGGM
jgi:hypothetical protein